MNEKLLALKGFISPKRLLVFKGTPPTVDERIDHLLKNPDIPTEGPEGEEVRKILSEGLKVYEISDLDRRISLLQKEKIVKEFLQSPRSVDERIKFIHDNKLIGGAMGEQTFHLMRQGLNETELNEFIHKLVMTEWNRAQKVQKSTNLREHSIYSTAIKFAVNEANKSDPITAADYVNNTLECFRKFKVPEALLTVAKEIANGNNPENIVFSMISGPLQNESSRQWEDAKKGADTEKTKSLESTFKDIQAASNKLNKLIKQSKDPNKKGDPDVQAYFQAINEFTSIIINRKEIGVQSNVNQSQTDNVQSVSEMSSPQTPRKVTPRSLRGAMKISSENLKSELSPEEIAGMKLSPRTTTQSQKSAEPPAEPTASTSGSETRPRSPKGIGTHRPPLPNFSPPSPPDTPPASPRGKPDTSSKQQPTTTELESFKVKTEELLHLDSKVDELKASLEARREATKSRLDELREKRAQLQEKTSQQQLTGSHPEGKESLPPQAKEMMTKSKVQQEKAEKAADATDAAKTNPISSTPSRGSERR